MRRNTRALAAALPVALWSILFSPPSTPAQVAQPDERPNILIIVTDDQRSETMSIMRRTRAWLDSGGVEFPNAYVTTPLCCPSRASIFTGQYVHNHGVGQNHLGGTLDADHTIQAYLKQAGYRTAIAGKYLNGVPLSHRPPHFERFTTRLNSNFFYGAEWNVQGRMKTLPEYESVVIRKRAERYLDIFERTDETPWFMYLAPTAPHLPAKPEQKYRTVPVNVPHVPSMHEDDLSDKPTWIQESPKQTSYKIESHARRQYRSLISVDDMVQRLMIRLRELKERGRTLVIFVSDNGFLWRDHGLCCKSVPYLPAVEVPMYLRWPGKVARGTDDSRIVANIDIAPTVLDVAGVESEHAMDGRSLLDRTWSRDRLLLEQWAFRHPAWDALVTPDLQYIEWQDPEGAGTVAEYYDLLVDPWQLRNLLGDPDPTNDPAVTALSLQLARDRACVGTTDSGPGGPPTCP